jgi:putative phosphoribosyl transferase
MTRLRYRDRADAGRQLAAALWPLRNRPDIVVLALPRGGVPVGYEVASAFGAPLDVFLVRKLGVPGYSELAMGAIASGGSRILNDDVIRSFGVDHAALAAVEREEQRELERRERQYRDGRPLTPLAGRCVVLIDDGLATGATMRAAVQAVKTHSPAEVIVAVPVGSPGTCRDMEAIADRVVCARHPDDFAAVGQWYDDFRQTTDAEVHDLLTRGSAAAPRG